MLGDGSKLLKFTFNISSLCVLVSEGEDLILVGLPLRLLHLLPLQDNVYLKTKVQKLRKFP